MLKEFELITPEEGRKLIESVGLLILLECDIEDAMVFDAVKKETKPLEGITYSNDHVALVMWSLKRVENKKGGESSKSDYSGGMIIKRVKDTCVKEATCMTLDSTKFCKVVVEKEAKEKEDLQAKLEVLLKAQNDAKLEITSRDKTIAELKARLEVHQQKGESSQLMIASSPSMPPPSSLIVEFPPSPMTSIFQSIDSAQDEIERLTRLSQYWQ